MKYGHRRERSAAHDIAPGAGPFARTARILTHWNPTRAESKDAAPVRAIAMNTAAVPSSRRA